jgi:uncharacterized protein
MSTHPSTSGPMEPLTEDECWEFIRTQRVGRIATAAVGEPEIFPINFAVGNRVLYFNTAPGTKLTEVTVNAKVAFEVDQWSADIAYSVMAQGTAEILETDADVADAESTGLVSFLDTDKPVWVRLTPTNVTGRRFTRP